MKRKLGLAGVAVFLFTVFSVPVFTSAADKAGPVRPGAASAKPPQVAPPNVFGTNTNILQIPASSFIPVDPGDATMTCDITTAYCYPSDPGWRWATVTLPAGANISYLDFYVYDTNVNFEVAANLRAYSGGDLFGTPPAYSDIAAVMSAADTGYGYFFSDPVSHTVNNDVAYNFGNQYAVLVNFPVTDGTLQFKGVDIWWNRQISPAPADASFSDVPTTHPFFAEIEALAASGISTGYADGTFKPGAYVTRQAMAAFLARALGLHWEY